MSENTNVATVRAIGKGVRLTDEAVAAIVAGLPADFDPTQRGAIADAVHVWACGDSPRPAVKTGPKGAQVTTDYGTGHDTLTRAVKRTLAAEDDSPKAVVLRASLSGEGGGSTTIPTDHPLYAAIVALIVGNEEQAAA